MAFYTSIAPYYDDIFPLSREQIRFIIEQSDDDTVSIAETQSRSKRRKMLLDIGCATGNLSLSLSQHGFIVTGIDADREMVHLARRKASDTQPESAITFFEADMKNLTGVFPSASFNVVVCFGNTLVHLTEPQSISSFVEDTSTLLTRNGVFLLQIINYDRILDNNISVLPTIENEKIRFERQYSYRHSQHCIEFTTKLTVKDHNKTVTNSVLLYPLRKAELTEYLKRAGFTNLRLYGDFSDRPFSEACLPLIVRACRE